MEKPSYTRPVTESEVLKAARIAAGRYMRMQQGRGEWKNYFLEYPEALSLAWEGADSAKRRWEPADAESSPVSWMYHRAMGAIKDHVRDSSPLSRDMYQKYVAGRDDSLADLLPPEMRFPISLEENYVSGRELDLADTLADKIDPAYEAIENASTLKRLFHVLPERERYVIEQHFFHQRTMKDIGTDLKVTESRICQMVANALKKMRKAHDAFESVAA